MSLKINIDFVNSFTNILHNQNKNLLKEICQDYGWDYDTMYANYLKDFKDFEYDYNVDEFLGKDLEDWDYSGKNYQVEKDTNNVYFNGKFVGKRFDNELYSDCSET